MLYMKGFISIYNFCYIFVMESQMIMILTICETCLSRIKLSHISNFFNLLKYLSVHQIWRRIHILAAYITITLICFLVGIIFSTHKKALITLMMNRFRYDRIKKGRSVAFIRFVKSILAFELHGCFTDAIHTTKHTFLWVFRTIANIVASNADLCGEIGSKSDRKKCRVLR